MGVRIKLLPGVRVRISSRGVRASVGPRIARVHVGTGRPGVSTGLGPAGIYIPLGRRRRPAPRKRPAQTQRSSWGGSRPSAPWPTGAPSSRSWPITDPNLRADGSPRSRDTALTRASSTLLRVAWKPFLIFVVWVVLLIVFGANFATKPGQHESAWIGLLAIVSFLWPLVPIGIATHRFIARRRSKRSVAGAAADA